MKNKEGFSLIDTMFLLILSAFLILATIPVLSKKKININKNSNIIQCIEIEDATDLNSPACKAAINGSLYNNTSYFDSLLSEVNSTNSAFSNAGIKILKYVCDQGGQHACDKVIDECTNNITKCERPGVTDDLEFYLSLLSTDINISKPYIKNILSMYYSIGMTNIKTEVDKFCCLNGFNLACEIKGTKTCSWEIKIGGTGTESVFNGVDNTGEIVSINASSDNIAIDGSNNIYITGSETSDSFGLADIFLIQLDIFGNIKWQKKIGGTNNDYGRGIFVDNSGYIYITGETWSNSYGNNDIFAMKLDSSGNILWQTKIGQTGKDYANGIAVDSSGNSYITGNENSDHYGASFSDAFLIKLDSTGSVSWQKKIGGSYDDFGNTIAVDNAGFIYIAGQELSNTFSLPIGTGENFIMKFDSTGGLQWQRKIGKGLADIVNAMAVDSSGNTYLTGTQYSEYVSLSDSTTYIIKVNTSGDVLWQKKIGTNHWGTGITLDNSNNIYITGFGITSTYGQCDTYLIKLDSSGNTLWQKLFGGTLNDISTGIVMDNIGNVYLTGQEDNDVYGASDIFLLKLNPTQTSNLNLTNADMNLNKGSMSLNVGDMALNKGSMSLNIGNMALNKSTLNRSKFSGL